MSDTRPGSGEPPDFERERFLYRISQIAALSLILSVSALTFALINFVGLNPTVSDVERRIAEVERAKAIQFYESLKARSSRTDVGRPRTTVGEAMEALDDASRDLDPDRRARLEELTREMEALLEAPAPGSAPGSVLAE